MRPIWPHAFDTLTFCFFFRQSVRHRRDVEKWFRPFGSRCLFLISATFQGCNIFLANSVRLRAIHRISLITQRRKDESEIFQIADSASQGAFREEPELRTPRFDGVVDPSSALFVDNALIELGLRPVIELLEEDRLVEADLLGKRWQDDQRIIVDQQAHGFTSSFIAITRWDRYRCSRHPLRGRCTPSADAVLSRCRLSRRNLGSPLAARRYRRRR